MTRFRDRIKAVTHTMKDGVGVVEQNDNGEVKIEEEENAEAEASAGLQEAKDNDIIDMEDGGAPLDV